MKILLITPLYGIKGRNNLFHDTSAIHYLIKPWAIKHDVVVINIYSQSLSKIVRYKNVSERRYYRNGYQYNMDNVRIYMCEIQRLYKQKAILDVFQSKRVMNFIQRILTEINFHPDIIVSHVPSTSLRVINQFDKAIPKIAILHMTDVLNTTNNPDLLNDISKLYNNTYARSQSIYNSFFKLKLSNLNKALILSGAPVSSINIEARMYSRKEKISILYVGKLIKRKQVDKIIEALSLFRAKFSFTLDVFGEGDQKEKLIELGKKKLGKSIEFHAPVSHLEILKFMKKSDIFVMPSINETLGLVYLEAMACGNLVIGSRNEGIDGIIKNKINGFLVNPNSVIDLASTLEEIFTLNYKYLDRIIFNAQKTAHYYSDTNMAMKYLDIIKNNIIV
ncbi:glycosyltransferase family 4 protein [Loigolactobacillus coryniformis]|uniref:glycosyltransferase family 4 protein n=1 Tax=Loigolactobacillus coryniformis TaxID=1610 RepID=UPI00201AFBE9|nr:glycosyltransferase family 4 protein [Loigolactobacillus coryniformis]MCL5457523.1 glycosyltransferase family 4 protein [Loigolactobacillus coryniformis]